MATRKKKPARTARTAAKKKPPARKRVSARKAAFSRKAAPARKAAPVRKRRRATPPPPAKIDVTGWITHTELSSRDPDATKAWAAQALGWKFRPSMPMPNGGQYHLYYYGEQGGGGIRPLDGNEAPGALPYISVKNCKEAYERALAAGAEGIAPPENIMPGTTIATVRAPGGVLIGLAGP